MLASIALTNATSPPGDTEDGAPLAPVFPYRTLGTRLLAHVLHVGAGLPGTQSPAASSPASPSGACVFFFVGVGAICVRESCMRSSRVVQPVAST